MFMDDNKKVTIRDVAKFAGVSVATVSYIMNERYDIKIKEETRKKVKQVANILNYVPNHTARSLATGHADVVGIAYRVSYASPAAEMETMSFVNLLVEKLSRMHYCVTFIPLEEDHASYKSKDFLQTVSAIIVLDLPEAQFHSFADNFYVPVISVDMLLDDLLFYQIYSDYAASLKKALEIAGEDCCVLMDKRANQAYLEFLTKNIPAGKLLFYALDTPDYLKKFKERNYVVLGTYLALFLKSYIPKEHLIVLSSGKETECLSDISTLIPMDMEKKANLIVNILLNSIEHRFSIAHQYPVGALDDNRIAQTP